MNTFHLHRDLRETRQRFDSVGSEIKRKDNQIRELQQRLEVNEGCKFHFHFNHSQINHSVFSFFFQFKNMSIHLFLKQGNFFLVFVLSKSICNKFSYIKNKFHSSDSVHLGQISKKNPIHK